jgi:hypothetical protein
MKRREFGRMHGDGMAGRELGHDRVKVEIAKALAGIDEEITIIFEALENVDRFEQRHVLDDQCIRHDDGLTQADFLGIDPTEGDDGSAHALGAKTWKGLRVLILEERGDGENVRRRDDALAATSMDADLQHAACPRLKLQFGKLVGSASRRPRRVYKLTSEFRLEMDQLPTSEPTTITWRQAGPWAPRTSVPSISVVPLGPVIKFTLRGIGNPAATIE